MRASLLAASLVVVTACISPSVLEPAERGVTLPVEGLEWGPAARADVVGTWGAASIEGALASSVWTLHYHFDPSGRFTGAALLAESPARYESVRGAWTFASGELRLDGGPPAAVSAARVGGRRYLRLSGDEGTLVLLEEYSG